MSSKNDIESSHHETPIIILAEKLSSGDFFLLVCWHVENRSLECSHKHGETTIAEEDSHDLHMRIKAFGVALPCKQLTSHQ